MMTETADAVADPIAQVDAKNEQIAQATPGERIEHLVKCTDCDFAVRFRPSASGAGFTLVDSDQALGIGDHGRPTCPNGHGELALADDQLPIEQAINQVAAQLQPEQRRLPGIVPLFNYAGAYLELETMSVEADRLHRIWEDDAREAKESKTQWEEASKRRDKAALEFRRRRLDKGEPLDESSAPAVDAPPDDADLWEAVKAAGQVLLPGTIEAWTDEECTAVSAWTADQNLERPKVLGRPHIAPNGYTSETHDDGQTSVEFQLCTQCDERILTITDGVEPYETSALVGTDCRGKAPARQIQKRGKKKAAGKKR